MAKSTESSQSSPYKLYLPLADSFSRLFNSGASVSVLATLALSDFSSELRGFVFCEIGEIEKFRVARRPYWQRESLPFRSTDVGVENVEPGREKRAVLIDAVYWTH